MAAIYKGIKQYFTRRRRRNSSSAWLEGSRAMVLSSTLTKIKFIQQITDEQVHSEEGEIYDIEQLVQQYLSPEGIRDEVYKLENNI